MTAPLDLPSDVIDLVEFHPVEDILLYLLRDKLSDIPAKSLIEDDPVIPFILVRRIPNLEAGGDERFVDAAHFSVEVFTLDPDGDEKGALISEAVRVILSAAWRSNYTAPGLGSIVKIAKTYGPVRQADWATSVGPVQYANLPTDTWRYESQYQIEVRRPL